MKIIPSLVILLLVKNVALQDGPFDPETVCEGYADDDKVGFGDDFSCTGYYSCYDGVGYPEDCPEGQQFDYTINDCEDEEVVQCQPPPDYGEYPEVEYPEEYPEYPEETDPPEQTPPSEISTIAPTTNPDQIDDITCPTNRPGEIIFFPSSNCTEYFICANGNRLRMSCMDGFTWNQELQQCDYPIFSKCSVKYFQLEKFIKSDNPKFTFFLHVSLICLWRE